MEALFLKVLELSVYGGLLILAILPVRLLLRKAPRWSVCLLWALAAFALVCPVRLESSVSVLPTVPITETVISPTLPTVQTAPILIPDLPVTEGVHTLITPTAPDYTEIGAVVWWIGMAVMLFAALISYLRLKRRIAASIPTHDNVYICDDIDTPFILGLLRPRIYLPSALDEITAHHVLLHEGAHLKRRDHWWKPLGYLLLTVHWFNPLVWVGYVLLCRDIELACDERVVRDMDTREKKHYSEALLECSMPRHLIAACPLAFGEVGVKQRIRAVLNYKKPGFWIVVIALVLCVVLAVTFLTDPETVTLGELSDMTAADVISIAVHKDLTSARSVSDINAVCELLSELELQQRMGRAVMDTDWAIISFDIENDSTAYDLYISPDRTRLWLTKQDSVTSIGYPKHGTYYKICTPDIVTTILYGDYLYQIEDNATTPDTALSFSEMETLIHEYLRSKNRSYANLEMHNYAHQSASGMTYTTFHMDNTARDGTVLSENRLYLAAFVNGRLDGLASGEWAMSAGYYPNVADFNGQTVLWMTRSDTHMALNADGSINPNKTVPNEYTKYRITCDDGSTVWWYTDGPPYIIDLQPGQKPVRIVPIDSKGNEVEAFAFEGNNLPVSDVNTVSEVSGWDMFLQMDAETGEIQVLCGYPLYNGASLYINMDKSFYGHEALFSALCNAEVNFPNLKLMGHQSLGAYEYAVIRYGSDTNTVTALVEYIDADGSITLCTYSEGDPPDETGLRIGYRMNCMNGEGGILYWSLYTPRYKVTANGKDIDASYETVTPAFSGFRFTMRDLKTHDFPATGDFFLAEFTTVIPPAIVTPMEGGRLLAALGSEPAGITQTTIHFSER